MSLILGEAHDDVWISTDLVYLIELDHAFHLHARLVQGVSFVDLKAGEASLFYIFQLFLRHYHFTKLI